MPEVPPERWLQIEQVYNRALEVDTGRREAFLEEACAGDDDLRREVRSLLGVERAATDFLERTALAEAAPTLAHEAGSDLVGRRLDGYEIVALIGAGGMGEVYRARDLRLDREIAVKVLERGVAADPEYRRRFEHEARSASALNHPNIVTIHGVGEDAGIAFIAMELVHGQTLRQQLSGGPMSVRLTLEIAVQLATALAAAHAKDIVHRDLKPENIMITADGLVKVLDFGIARRQDTTAAAHPATDRTTLRMNVTDAGAIVGTVGYMSPEQALGRPVGPASDQFSLGTILYEMLSGRRAFQHDSRIETLAAIVNLEPTAIQSLNPGVPALVQRIIARCLSKDPERRYGTTSDLVAELRRARDGLDRGLTRRQMIWIGVGAAAAGIAGTATWALWPLPTLAILPFRTRGGNDGVEYLCLGLTESLINRIKQLPVAVKSFSLVSHFAGATDDPRAIGRQLGVAKVIAGDVAARGGRLQISAELVDAVTGATLWKKQFDGLKANMFTLWDEIATAVVDDALHLRLTRDERRALLSRPTDNVEAFDFFLQARPFQMADSEEDYLSARGLLQRAVDTDQQFAEAWVALAGTYWTSVLDSYMRPAEAWPEVERCLARASALNPRLSDLRFGRAVKTFFGSWKWNDANREFQEACTAPDRDIQPELLLLVALARWALGDPREALRVVRRARAVDPLSPMFMLHEASYLTRTGQPDEAAGRCQSVIDAYPAMSEPYFYLAEVRRDQRRFDDAIEARRKAHAVRGDRDEELQRTLADASGRAGYERIEAAAAQMQLRTLGSRARRGYASPLDFARAYAQIGDSARALDYMDQALEERSPGLVFLNVDRAWDNIRREPGFGARLRSVGLPLSAGA